MSQIQVNVDRVASFDHTSGSDGILRLRSAGPFVLDAKDRRFPVWSRMIQERIASDGPVYVESEMDNHRVKNLFQPSLRQIEIVASQPEGERLNVVLLMAQSMFWVRTKHPNYEQLRRELTEGVQSGAKIWVTAHPDTQEILDARSGLVR